MTFSLLGPGNSSLCFKTWTPVASPRKLLHNPLPTAARASCRRLRCCGGAEAELWVTTGRMLSPTAEPPAVGQMCQGAGPEAHGALGGAGVPGTKGKPVTAAHSPPQAVTAPRGQKSVADRDTEMLGTCVCADACVHVSKCMSALQAHVSLCRLVCACVPMGLHVHVGIHIQAGVNKCVCA